VRDASRPRRIRQAASLPEIGEVWRDREGQRREVDYVGATHVGYRLPNGLRNLETHEVWRRWAAGAERVAR